MRGATKRHAVARGSINETMAGCHRIDWAKRAYPLDSSLSYRLQRRQLDLTTALTSESG